MLTLLCARTIARCWGGDGFHAVAESQHLMGSKFHMVWHLVRWRVAQMPWYRGEGVSRSQEGLLSRPTSSSLSERMTAQSLDGLKVSRLRITDASEPWRRGRLGGETRKGWVCLGPERVGLDVACH